MPDWKKMIVKKRREEQAASDAVRQEEDAQRYAKMAEIAAMPEWRRKLYLERNPQYKTE